MWLVENQVERLGVYHRNLLKKAPCEMYLSGCVVNDSSLFNTIKLKRLKQKKLPLAVFKAGSQGVKEAFLKE
jgi:hypothetical protein